MNIADKLPAIQSSLAQFTGFSAVAASNELVIVRNNKNTVCAHVTVAGVEQKYAGAKNLCGSLVRNALVAAIK